MVWLWNYAIFLLVLSVIFAITGIAIKQYTKTKIKNMLKENDKYVRFLRTDINTLEKYILNAIDRYPVYNIENVFWENLYEYYTEKEMTVLRSKTLKHSYMAYQYQFIKENNFQNFRILNLKDIDSIIFEVDKSKEQEEK